MHNLRTVPVDRREIKIQRLHSLAQRARRHARQTLNSDNTAAGREIANALDREARLLEWAVDELEKADYPAVKEAAG